LNPVYSERFLVFTIITLVVCLPGLLHRFILKLFYIWLRNQCLGFDDFDEFDAIDGFDYYYFVVLLFNYWIKVDSYVELVQKCSLTL
jgi:hypothetical protein